MINVITNTGSVEHLSMDGKRTLCGRTAHGEGTMGRKCKRCATKRDKLTMQETTDRFIAESDARLAAPVTHYVRVYRPQAGASGKLVDRTPDTETLVALSALRREVDATGALGKHWADRESGGYQFAGEIVTWGPIETPAPVTEGKWDAVLRTTSRAGFNVTTPEPERVPMDVMVTTRDGDRITYAHIPNGDPERVAYFAAMAERSGAFTDIKATSTPDPTEWEREQAAQWADVAAGERFDAEQPEQAELCHFCDKPVHGATLCEPAQVIHYGESSILCGADPSYVGEDRCRGGDGPCLNGCNCGCESGVYECSCSNVMPNVNKVTCDRCREALHRPVDAPLTACEPTGVLPTSSVCPTCLTRPSAPFGLSCPECYAEAEREALRSAAPVLTWRMVDAVTGEPFTPGPRESSQGRMWRIVKISRTPEPGKGGKIMATAPDGWTQEFYPSVFGLKIVPGESGHAAKPIVQG